MHVVSRGVFAKPFHRGLFTSAIIHIVLILTGADLFLNHGFVDAMPNSFGFFELFARPYGSFNDLVEYVFWSGNIPENKGYIFIHAIPGFLTGFPSSSRLHLLVEAIIHYLIIWRFYCFYLKHNPPPSTLKVVLIYFLFPSFAYSLVFLRDNLILLLCVESIYLVMYSKISLVKIVNLACISALLLLTRIESGLFIIMLVSFIIFSRSGNKLIISALVLLVLVYFSSRMLSFFDNLYYGYVVYSEYTSDRMNDGMGSMLYNLPFGKVLVVIHGLLQVPVWFLLTKAKSGYTFALLIGISNFFGAMIVVRALTNLHRARVVWRRTGTDVKILVYSLLFFLGVNSVNFTHRRILLVYFFLLLYSSIMKWKLASGNTVVMVFALHLIYIILKL